jgi:hypothetical protein
MIAACHIFLVSLKMNQDEYFLQENFADIMDEDEDFEIIGGKDLQCEEDFEIVEHPHNSEPSKPEVISQSQISLELGQQLQNRDAEKESLGNILKRLFLPCMIIAIWLPLIKILIFNRAKTLFRTWKMHHLEEEEIEFLKDCIVIDIQDTISTQEKSFFLVEEKKQIMDIIKLLFLSPVIQHIWLPLARYISSKMYEKLKYELKKNICGKAQLN